MINLDISNYSPPYNRLNGQTTQNINPFDVARGMVTVGRGSWPDVFNLGIFRIGELICKALAFSKIDNGNLVIHDRFFNLNQSEKVTVSYYFGQALTKLYSEKFFKIKWLFHIDDYDDVIQYHRRGTATSKLIVGRTRKIAERPDLIGFKRTRSSHIFEAKGYSGGYDTSVMQHTINQVSQINSYNGVAPETRTACYYDLSGSPLRYLMLGVDCIIIDPENDGKGVDIELNEETVISRYYSFLQENNQYFNINFRYGDYEYLTTPVGVPNIYFGFDKRILKLKLSEILEKGLYPDSIEFPTIDDTVFREVSVGLDGIILINK